MVFHTMSTRKKEGVPYFHPNVEVAKEGAFQMDHIGLVLIHYSLLSCITEPIFVRLALVVVVVDSERNKKELFTCLCQSYRNMITHAQNLCKMNM